MMIDADAATLAGQAAYTPRSLWVYDALVLGLSNRFIWHCPTPRLLKHYDRYVSNNHLDVGVATGFFLDRCRFPSGRPRLALLDLNKTCLATASRRIARYQPRCIHANVLAPLNFDGPPFDSIGLCYLLHCLPGDMAAKAVVFDHLRAWLEPGGTLFGATILGKGIAHNAVGRALMALYNQKGIFGNRDDDLSGLEAALRARFAGVEIEMIGRVAVFAARA